MSSNPSQFVNTNASSARRVENSQNDFRVNSSQDAVNQRQSYCRNNNHSRRKFNYGVEIPPRKNNQGSNVRSGFLMLNQVASPPPPSPSLSSQTSWMYGIVPNHQICTGLGPNPWNSNDLQDWQRRHNVDISSSSNPFPLGEPAGPQGRISFIFDVNWNRHPISTSDLPNQATVLNQENDTGNLQQGNSYGIGTIGILGTSSILNRQSIHGSQTFPSLGGSISVLAEGIETTTQESNNPQVADTVPMDLVVLDSLFDDERGIDDSELTKMMEVYQACVQTLQPTDPNNQNIGTSQFASSPSHGNTLTNSLSSNENENNNAENIQGEREGTKNDEDAPANEGTNTNLETECGFAGLVPYLMNDNFEDLIKWPDEDFIHYTDPYGFDF